MSVSVVIPCYNSERWLGEALASVRAQSRPADEVIVVDDASTDSSAALVERVDGVRLIRSARNAGAATARNTGLAAAQGDLVAWLDADDVWTPDHLETVVGLLDRHPGAALGFSLMQTFGDRDSVWEAALAPETPASAFWHTWRHSIVPVSTCVLRRAVALDLGGFDPSLRCVEDFEFFLRLSRHHDFVCTHAITGRYRKHAASLSRQFLECVIQEFQIRGRFLERARSTEDPAFAARLETEWHREWNDRLLEAWTRRDLPLLRFYLGLTIGIPGSGALAERWRRKARLAGLWRIWDALHFRRSRPGGTWPGG